MSDKIKDLNKWTRGDFLSLPRRNWDAKSRNKGVVIFPGRKKHDSGYANIIICGMWGDSGSMLISDYSDDISWEVAGRLITDSLLLSKSFRFWVSKKNAQFEIGHALSSIDICY